MKKNSTVYAKNSTKHIEFKIFFALIILLLSFSAINSQVSQSEFEALKALYKSTDGDNWTQNTNWDTTSTANDVTEDWYGLSLYDGHVIIIDIRDNNLVGSLPPEIGDFPELNTLIISGNRNLNGNLSGEIPPEIGNLTKLHYLFLYENNFTGSIPSEIGNLTNLETTWLSDNNLTGSIPAEIGNLTNLKEIYFPRNNLSGNIPSEIGNLSKLTKLSLAVNQLTGIIPVEICDLSSLAELDLKSNLLTGNIPKEIGNLNNLTNLDISGNQLSGYIPSEIGNLSNLYSLDINNNQLTGNIPTEIENLTNLNYIYLYDNQLIGTIPSGIGNLTNLGVLALQNNQLKGDVPSSIVNLVNMYSLDLSYNLFTSLPDMSSLTSAYISVTNNNLSFEDIEPNISVLDEYSPQAKVGEEQNIHLEIGANYTLSIDIGGTANTYQWYKNSSPISGATDSTYEITNFQLSDEGNYYCIINNTIATSLTLQSYNITLTNSDVPEIVISENYLDFDDVEIGKDSVIVFTISGSNLTNDIQVSLETASQFQISTDSSTFTSSLSITQVGGVIQDTLIYIKYTPDGATTFFDLVTCSSINATTKSVELWGKAHYLVVKNTENINSDYNIKIYPNPTNDYICIDNKQSTNYFVTITNSQGKTVKKLSSCNSLLYIDLSEQTTGFYFIKILSKEGVYYSKIIKY